MSRSPASFLASSVKKEQEQWKNFRNDFSDVNSKLNQSLRTTQNQLSFQIKNGKPPAEKPSIYSPKTPSRSPKPLKSGSSLSPSQKSQLVLSPMRDDILTVAPEFGSNTSSFSQYTTITPDRVIYALPPKRSPSFVIRSKMTSPNSLSRRTLNPIASDSFPSIL
ncbi:hypothetical protein RCL1_002921 [Eukaryota sp. TZLM3-RCL]